MRLHDHPRSSNAQKVRFLLGVLGLEYERRTVPFEAPRPDWHLAVNPLGGIPALIDGELVLAESNAILRYLAEREGRDDLLPGDARRARARSTGCSTPSPRRCGPPAARSTRPPTASGRSAASGRSRREPDDVPAAIARIAPRLDRLLAPARRRRLRLPRPPHGGRLRRDAVALAPAARGRPPGPRAAARLGRDGRRAPRLGARSRPRAGCRRDHEPRQRARQGRPRARRGEGAPAHRPLRRRGRGCAARRAGGRHRRRSRSSSTTTSAATASPTSCSRRARKVLRCSAEVMAALSTLSSTSRAVGVLRANDLPPLAAGSPASQVGLQLHGVADPGQPRHAAAQRAGLRARARRARRGLRRSALAARRAREHGRALLGARDHAARGARAAADRPRRPRRPHARRARARSTRRVRARRRARRACRTT